MAHVNVSSWVRGNRLEEMEAATVGDILQRQSISTNESNVEVVDAAGNSKPSRVNTPLADGDTVQIMKKSTKSGTTGRTNGVQQAANTPLVTTVKPISTTNVTKIGTANLTGYVFSDNVGNHTLIPVSKLRELFKVTQ